MEFRILKKNASYFVSRVLTERSAVAMVTEISVVCEHDLTVALD